MGYNTVAVILNDALGAIEDDPNIGKGIGQAVRGWHGRSRDPFAVEVDARSGRCCHGRAIAIISQDHADGEQVTIVHGNTGWTADEAEPGKHTALSWRGLDQMQRCLERHGYQVTKPKKAKAAGRAALSAGDGSDAG